MDVDDIMVTGMTFLLSGLAGALFGLFTVGVIVDALVTDQFHREAIQRGLATYCAPDGEFRWKGECE